MVINDATYLLDESLLALKKIHDIETLKESNEWSSLGDEERQMKEEALLEAKRGVRNWLILGRDTLDLFTYLTADAPEPFYESVCFVFPNFFPRLLAKNSAACGISWWQNSDILVVVGIFSFCTPRVVFIWLTLSDKNHCPSDQLVEITKRPFYCDRWSED